MTPGRKLLITTWHIGSRRCTPSLARGCERLSTTLPAGGEVIEVRRGIRGAVASGDRRSRGGGWLLEPPARRVRPRQVLDLQRLGSKLREQVRRGPAAPRPGPASEWGSDLAPAEAVRGRCCASRRARARRRRQRRGRAGGVADGALLAEHKGRRWRALRRHGRRLSPRRQERGSGDRPPDVEAFTRYQPVRSRARCGTGRRKSLDAFSHAISRVSRSGSPSSRRANCACESGHRVSVCG